MHDSITVACVLRSGGIYTPEWVARLQRGVSRHLTLPHRFVALSDADVPCERIPLETNWPGWWSKIELFRPGLFAGPVLYMDLDTVVVGALDAMANYPHRFTMAHEFYRPAQFCSTAMAWHGDYSDIWSVFSSDSAALMHAYDSALMRATGRIGDQAFIEDRLRVRGITADTFRNVIGPRSVASYKVDHCQDGPPHDAAIVAFHGRPKPHALRDGWVPTTWQ